MRADWEQNANSSIKEILRAKWRQGREAAG
jgi:hypothetical protein